MANKKKEVETVESDYLQGVTNFRVLAEKHDKTLKEVAEIVNPTKK